MNNQLTSIAEALNSGKTQKISELAFELGVFEEELMEDLWHLSMSGVVEMGGYSYGDPIKFVRLTISKN